MDDRPEPRRIEIELTSHEPVTTRSVPSASDDATIVEGHESGSGLVATERGRLVAGGVVVACVALLLGVFVGRMGSGEVASDDREPASTTTEVAAPTTTRARSTDTLPSAPRVFTTTTSPRTPLGAPVDPEELVKGMIAVNPDVAAAPIEVVAMTIRGDIVRIDVSTGLTITTTVENAQFGPPTIYAGDGWILVPSFNEERGSTVLFDDGRRSTFDVGSSWPLLPGRVDGTFWRFDVEVTNIPNRLIEVSINEPVPLSEVELSGHYPQMADPLGGVVVQAPGGYYNLSPDSRTRLTAGVLVGLGLRRALVRECTEALECGYFVVDRATGGRTALSLDPSFGGLPQIDSGGWWGLEKPMSPDESALLISYWGGANGGQSSGVLDLTTGEYQHVADLIDTPYMDWGPDNRSVYWIDRGRLKVFDRDTGESILFSEDLGTINAFTLRPSLPSVDGPSDTIDGVAENTTADG